MTETESMVVRVAKAMIAAIDGKEAFVRENDGICDVTVDGHVDFKALARASIEAMKTPTPGMLQAGVWADSEDGASDNPQDIWSAMIVKALEE